jgi:antitoxin FitA
MTSIVVPITEEKLKELKRRATEYNISPERLVQAAVDELLIRKDDKFNRALEYVLEKNKELYKRLA